MKYPKINSLWKRQGWYFDEKDKKNTAPEIQSFRQSFIVGDYACPEFAAINLWQIDEKIDGTNIRIFWDVTDSLSPTFGGRTDAAQIPQPLLTHLQKTFTREKLHKQFPDSGQVVLFGEGYGPKIQACGGRYRKDVSFILFDVCVGGCWLEKQSVAEVAIGLGIEYTTFSLAPLTTDEVVKFVKSKPKSRISDDPTLEMEGVIARSYPMMLFRHSKTPVMFKLKCKEFPDESN